MSNLSGIKPGAVTKYSGGDADLRYRLQKSWKCLTSEHGVAVWSRFQLYQSDHELPENGADKVAHQGYKGSGKLSG